MAPHPWPAPPHLRPVKLRPTPKPEIFREAPTTPERFRRWSKFSHGTGSIGDSVAASTRDAVSCASSSLDQSTAARAKRKKSQFSPEPLGEPEPEVSLADYSGGMLALSPSSPKRCDDQSGPISPSEGTSAVITEDSSVTLEMPKVVLGSDTSSSWGCEWAEWAARWQELETSVQNSMQLVSDAVSPVQVEDGCNVSFRIDGTPEDCETLIISKLRDLDERAGESLAKEQKVLGVQVAPEDITPTRHPSEVSPIVAPARGSESVCIAVLGKDGSKTFYAPPEGKRKPAQERVSSLASLRGDCSNLREDCNLRGDCSPQIPAEVVIATLEQPAPLATGTSCRQEMSLGKSKSASVIPGRPYMSEAEIGPPIGYVPLGSIYANSALTEPETNPSLHDISFGPSSASCTPDPSLLWPNTRSRPLQRNGGTPLASSERTAIVSPPLQTRVANGHPCCMYTQAVAPSRSTQRSPGRPRWNGRMYFDEVKFEHHADAGIDGFVEKENADPLWGHSSVQFPNLLHADAPLLNRPSPRRRCRTASPPVAVPPSSVFVPCGHLTPPGITPRNTMTPYRQPYMGWANYGA